MNDDRTSLKEVVADYLHKNPDFLDENPEILQTLELSHRSGTAVSLIERQVDQLRTANEALTVQLNGLLLLAAENEKLITRLHRLTLELMPIQSRKTFFTRLGNSLLNDFNADILQICLLDIDIAADAGEDVMGIQEDDPSFEPFKTLFAKGETICGRFNETKMEFLFGSKARWVQSTALIPLGEAGSLGMMAIGSSDRNRFYPGMGTLFLDLLSDVIATKLLPDQQEEQRRSA